MLTLNATQQALLDRADKTVGWAIYVTDKNGVEYAWLSEEIWVVAWQIGTAWTSGTVWQAGKTYTNVIMYGFSGINLRRTSPSSRIIAPSDISVNISNKGSTLTWSDFRTGTVRVELVITDGTTQAVIAKWAFSIKDATPGYQAIGIQAEDFLAKHLRGDDYTNTRFPEQFFPSERSYARPGVCVPLPFGTAYVPLRDVYIGSTVTITAATLSVAASSGGSNCIVSDSGNGLGSFEQGKLVTISGFTDANNNGTFRILKGGVAAGSLQFPYDAGMVTEAAGDTVTIVHGSNYMILGDTTNTYTISEVRNPKELGDDSTFTSGSYTFNQSTIADADSTNWRALQAILSDVDQDGTADTPASFGGGGNTYDPLVKFTRSDTASTTNPADVIEAVLLDMGVPAGRIDNGTGSSFATAKAVYTGQSLTFNGAYWYKQSREKVLAQLLIMCHSTFRITDKIELHVLSKTSQKTLTKANVMRRQQVGEGTFRYRPIVNESNADGGFVTWQKSGEPQDKFLKVLVPEVDGASVTAYSQDVLEVPFVSDSQDVQRIGTLYYQRKLAAEGRITFTGLTNTVAMQPDDVVTINHADYGGSYAAVIDSVKINRDASVGFQLTKYDVTLEDWADVAPGALTVPADDTKYAWQPTTSGPQASQDVASSGYTIWGVVYSAVVAPNVGAAEFTDIQAALNSLTTGGVLYIKKGTYTLTDVIYMPNQPIAIVGEQKAGVIIQNIAGSNGINFDSPTAKKYSIKHLTINSQNVAAYSNMISMDSANGPEITIDDIDITLIDASTYAGNGDQGIQKGERLPFGPVVSSGKITITNCTINRGKNGIYIDRQHAGVIVTGNTLTNQRNIGIYVKGVAAEHAMVIAANAVTGYWYKGIYIEDQAAEF